MSLGWLALPLLIMLWTEQGGVVPGLISAERCPAVMSENVTVGKPSDINPAVRHPLHGFPLGIVDIRITARLRDLKVWREQADARRGNGCGEVTVRIVKAIAHRDNRISTIHKRLNNCRKSDLGRVRLAHVFDGSGHIDRSE